MTPTTAPTWGAKRTDETQMVERVLREAGFETVDVYRYNSASIRVRVIDQRRKRRRKRGEKGDIINKGGEKGGEKEGEKEEKKGT
jgi:hypothetical protein